MGIMDDFQKQYPSLKYRAVYKKFPTKNPERENIIIRDANTKIIYRLNIGFYGPRKGWIIVVNYIDTDNKENFMRYIFKTKQIVDLFKIELKDSYDKEAYLKYVESKNVW